MLPWEMVVSSCVASYDSPLSLSSLGRGVASPFTRSFLWSWGYHLNCWSGGQHGFLVTKMEVHGGLQLQGQVSGLLSFIKVYLGFLLDSKFDEVIVGRPLSCGLPVNHMGHPDSQLRVHALKEVIN